MSIIFSWDLFQSWVTAITLLLVVSYELMSPELGDNRLFIDTSKFRNVVIGFLFLFFMVYGVKVYLLVFR